MFGYFKNQSLLAQKRLRAIREIEASVRKVRTLQIAAASDETVRVQLEQAEIEIADRLERLPLYGAPLWPLDIRHAVLIGIVLATIPAYLAWNGWGSYLRFGWLLFLILWLIAGPLLLAVGSGMHWIWLRKSGALRRLKWLPPPPSYRILEMLVLAVLFVAGGVVGIKAREIRSRGVADQCDLILQKVEDFRAQHGDYPATINAVPELREWIQSYCPSMQVGVLDIYESIPGRSFIDDQPTLYLSEHGYTCVVTVERPLFMSFTRYRVLVKSSKHPDWKDLEPIWYLTVRK